jgi:hypothetical protein
MGLALALGYGPKFRFQILHVVEDKTKLVTNHDGESVKEYPSPITLEDALVDYENEFTFDKDVRVVVDTSKVSEVFSMENFMTYYTLKLAALDVEFRSGEIGDENPYPTEYQEDEANPFEGQEPDEQVWNPPR